MVTHSSQTSSVTILYFVMWFLFDMCTCSIDVGFTDKYHHVRVVFALKITGLKGNKMYEWLLCKRVCLCMPKWQYNVLNGLNIFGWVRENSLMILYTLFKYLKTRCYTMYWRIQKEATIHLIDVMLGVELFGWFLFLFRIFSIISIDVRAFVGLFFDFQQIFFYQMVWMWYSAVTQNDIIHETEQQNYFIIIMKYSLNFMLTFSIRYDVKKWFRLILLVFLLCQCIVKHMQQMRDGEKDRECDGV